MTTKRLNNQASAALDNLRYIFSKEAQNDIAETFLQNFAAGLVHAIAHLSIRYDRGVLTDDGGSIAGQ